MPTSPALAAVYATWPGSPVSADADEIRTMRPSPDSRSESKAARTTWNCPVRFESMSFRQSSGGKRSARWIVSTTPAFATTESQPPSCSSTPAIPASTASRSRTSKSSMSQPATVHPASSSSSTVARPMPPRAPVTTTRRPVGESSSSASLEPIPLPVTVRDVRRVLVPVPGAGIAIEIGRRVARVDRVADPLDRKDLVHEGAVRAVDREALSVVRPVVLFLHHCVALFALVPTHAPQPLSRAAGVHPERHLLVVLIDRERTRLRTGSAARVCAPGCSEELHDLLAV